jgi:uncharacterized delta-60 repeat protein
MHAATSTLQRMFTVVVLAAATAISTQTLAAPGDLDTAFNSSGVVKTAISSVRAQAHAVAIQPDGKLIVAGETCGVSTLNCDFLVERLTGDGALDTTFNSSGIAATDYNGNNDYAYSLAVTSAGRIIVAGYSCSTAQCSFLAVRYISDGSYDTTFGGSGFVVADQGSTDAKAYALILQHDGKIVLGGYSFNGTNDDFSMVRYNSDGTLDLGFGSGGVVTTGFGANDDQINAVVLQPDGKIIAAGQSCAAGSRSCVFAIARYNSDGSLDITYNSNGKVTTPLGSGDARAYALALQYDGKAVLIGQSCNLIDTNCSFAAARYDTDGRLDTTFNSTGTVTTAIGSVLDIATSAAVQPDGKIVAVGYSFNGANNDFALARYNDDGTLDAAFGAGGKVTTDIAGGGDQGNAVALQADGKIVAAGGSVNTTSAIVSIARYDAESGSWDLTPDPFSFTNVTNVTTGSLQTSNLITISGLGTGIEVPVTVINGQYAQNGSTAYSTDLGWAKNGDQFNVQHTASAFPGQTASTGLLVGGIVPTNNATITLGANTSSTFTSTTQSAAGSGGGGVTGPLSLLLVPAVAVSLCRRGMRDAA